MVHIARVLSAVLLLGFALLSCRAQEYPSKPVYSKFAYEIVATSPEQTAQYFKTELAKYTKVAQVARIRGE